MPSTGTSCSLPQLPDDRYGHSVERYGLICGGNRPWVNDTCVQWDLETGSWEDKQLTLDIERSGHVIWTPNTGIGTFLMGGWTIESQNTTTLMKPDGTQEQAFPLKYDT